MDLKPKLDAIDTCIGNTRVDGGSGLVAPDAGQPCDACIDGGGAIDKQRTKNRFVLDILERNLNSDPELIRQNNTYYFLKKNQAVVRENGLRILLVCGENDTWKESAVTFRAALQEREIPCQLKLVPDTGHNLRDLSRAEGDAAAVFQDRAFREALSRTHKNSRDSAATPADGWSIASCTRMFRA